MSRSAFTCTPNTISTNELTDCPNFVSNSSNDFFSGALIASSCTLKYNRRSHCSARMGIMVVWQWMLIKYIYSNNYNYALLVHQFTFLYSSLDEHIERV